LTEAGALRLIEELADFHTREKWRGRNNLYP